MMRSVSWSDFRSRIAIVTTLGFYLLSFEFNLNGGKFKIPNFIYDFKREKRETNTNFAVLPSFSVSLAYHIPSVRLRGV